MTYYSINTEQHSCDFRWAVDVNTVPDESLAKLSALLPGTEQAEVAFYRQKDDQKRALISRVLQRSCVSKALGVEWDAVVIERTRGRKPFAASHLPRPAHAPNFNFNVSHEGNYVVLASEPQCLCGVDVCSPSQRIAAIQRFADSQRQKAAHEQGHGRRHANTHALAGHSDHAPHGHGDGPGPGPGQSAEHAHAATSHDGHALVIDYLLTTFRRQLSPYEAAQVSSAGPGALACFQRLWALKEAYVKARGDGLGFDPLSRAEFIVDTGTTGARLRLDGQMQDKWVFHLQQLLGGHWVAVARGPPQAVVDADQVFARTLLMRDEQSLLASLRRAFPPFQIISLDDVVP